MNALLHGSALSHSAKQGKYMSKQIPPERQVAYYFGGFIALIGILMFFSVIFTGMTSAGDKPFDHHNEPDPAVAVIGMILVGVGAVIASIGSRGMAGSGVILDPEKAREDLEPYSRQVGGMVKDALDEAGVKIGGRPEKVVMIKCQSCGKLNEEDSKFCQECGASF
jgi:hypothetical protein